jgi:hypothetical protein
VNRILLSICVSAMVMTIIGCASSPDQKDYRKISAQKAFDEYFPKSSGNIQFGNLDEAYDYINTARAKLSLSINKNRAKGLTAKLTGQTIPSSSGVNVSYFLTADSKDLDDQTNQLENSLSNAVSVSSVFFVFSDSRGIVISDFYLRSGYQYTNNSQYESFSINGKNYKAEYAVGWGIEKAFQYLRDETK